MGWNPSSACFTWLTELSIGIRSFREEQKAGAHFELRREGPWDIQADMCNRLLEK